MQTTMKKIILTVCAFSLCTVGILNAQSLTSINYSIAIPTGDISDFIGKASFRGINFDYQKLVQPNIGVGVSFGLNVFYEEQAYSTYTVDNASLSGKQWRYSNHVPLYISANYFLKPGEQVNPFVGLGVGTIYSRRNTDMNLYTIEQEAWNFGLQPCVGVLFRGSDQNAVHVSARYNYGFKAGNELLDAQSYISLNLGISFGRM